jgi:hypothetical protein
MDSLRNRPIKLRAVANVARYSRGSSPKISRLVYILCMEGIEGSLGSANVNFADPASAEPRYRDMSLCPPAALTGHHGDLSAEGVPLLRHWLRQLLDAYMSNYRAAQPMNAVCESA